MKMESIKGDDDLCAIKLRPNGVDLSNSLMSSVLPSSLSLGRTQLAATI